MSEKNKDTSDKVENIISWLHLEKAKLESMVASQHQAIKVNEAHIHKIQELLNFIKGDK